MGLVEIFVKLAPNSNEHDTEPLVEKLLARYNAPQRKYHNRGHLDQGLQSYFACFRSISPENFFAWMYHDAFYDPVAEDNEDRSARLFLQDRARLGFDMETAEEVADLIITTNHRTDKKSVVTDMDLSILGAPEPIYQMYADAIRSEYLPFFSEEAYKKGRLQVLARFLGQSAAKTLFFSDSFEKEYGERVVENLHREITQLAGKDVL